MRSLLILVVVVVLAAAIGAYYLPGPASFTLGGWIVEVGPVFLMVSLVIVFVVLHMVVLLFSSVLNLPGRLRKALDNRRRDHAQAALAEGLGLLLEGKWMQAEKRFKQGFEHPRQAVHCYLGAAEAASHQGERGRCLYYLKQASQSGKRADLQAGLLEARLLCSSGEESAAVARLEELQQKYRGNRLLNERLLDAYRASEDWDSAARYAERLPMPREERDNLLLQAHLGRLRAIKGAESDRDRLEQTWQATPRHMRHNPRLVKAYVTESLRFSGAEHCEPLLRKVLRKRYNPELTVLYALVQGTNPARQLAFLESLLKRHPDDPQLLLATGILSSRLKLWGRARSYIEQSRSADPRPENLRAMANLLEQQGEFEAAAQCYRQGLDMISGGAPELTAKLLDARPAAFDKN